MKVLIVSAVPPPMGGIASWTVDYLGYFRNHGYQVVLINTALQGKRSKNITSTSSFLDEIARTFGIFVNLIKGLVSRPTVVHFNTSCSARGIIRDAVCILLIKLRRVPIVLHCHCNIEDQIHSSISRWVFCWVAKKADSILVLNSKSAAFLSETIGIGKAPTILPNFIKSNATIKTNTKTKIETITYVGHVTKAKGCADIIEVAKAFPGIIFQLIGPVSEEILETKIGNNVKLLGAKNHEDILPVLMESDLFLFLSYTEGFSLSLLEAMAAGLPVIATDVGANADMIEDKGGIITRPGQIAAVCQAINKLDSQNTREEMAKWNVNKVKQHYEQEKVLSKLVQIYEEVIV